MFDSQPKMVFMENFRWSKEALSQQNLQLLRLGTSLQVPKLQKQKGNYGTDFEPCLCANFSSKHILFPYSDISSLIKSKNIFLIPE